MLQKLMKIVYTAVLMVLVLLKADLIAGSSGRGMFPAPAGEADQVTQRVEKMIKPWNYAAFEGAIAPELKARMQIEGLNLFYNALSRSLGYVRSAEPALYVRESLVTQWLNGGRLYRIEAACQRENARFEVRVRRSADGIQIYEFAVEAASLGPVYDAAVRASQSGTFNSHLFTRAVFTA